MSKLQEQMSAAYEAGVDAAKAAAAWSTDGNMSNEHYARMIAMFDEGDPALYDYLPREPNLSGEWAGESMAEILTSAIGEEPAPDDMGDIAEEWERGVSETFSQECERLIRAALA